MNTFVGFGVGMLLALTPVLGAADELPPFEGPTIADPVLKRQAVKGIAEVVQLKFACSVVDRVKTEAAGRHVTPRIPGVDGPATYERWTATACSKEQGFWVTFYRRKDGSLVLTLQVETASDSR